VNRDYSSSSLDADGGRSSVIAVGEDRSPDMMGVASPVALGAKTRMPSRHPSWCARYIRPSSSTSMSAVQQNRVFSPLMLATGAELPVVPGANTARETRAPLST
jgi:hypothetical protein